MTTAPQDRVPGLASLRRLISRRAGFSPREALASLPHSGTEVPRGLKSALPQTPSTERCELCGVHVGDSHQHLMEPRSRRLVCACDACALLFPDTGVAQYARVPRDIYALDDFQMSDAFWNGLSIPIGLVFFFRSSVSGQTVSLYPSPAGTTESEVDGETWAELIALNPSLADLRADIEGLLVNRLKHARQYYIAPIDECFKLAGLIRKYWRGFSGGEEAWGKVAEFFDDLQRRSGRLEVANRA
jgi:Family of unknown function (DUF5947)